MRVLGDNSPLPFPLLVSARMLLGPDRVAALVAVGSIAISVALAAGLEMAARSLEADVQRSAQAVWGDADVALTGGRIGVPEALVGQVESLPEVVHAAPVIEVTLRHAAEPLVGQAIRVIGIDLLQGLETRSYVTTSQGVEVKDPLRLLVSPDSLIVSEVLADRLALSEGEPLEVRSEAGVHTLVVRGLLRRGGLGDAFNGQIAIMDVYALQALLGREGWVDRVEIVGRLGVDREDLLAALDRALGSQVRIDLSPRRSTLAENAVSTVRLALSAVVAVGALAAALISFATSSTFVNRQVHEFAVLRAAGMHVGGVRRIVGTMALANALVGTSLGLWLGSFLSEGFVDIFSGISESFSSTTIERLEPAASTILVAVVVGVIVSLFGAWEPIHRAGTHAPLDQVSLQPVGRDRRGLAASVFVACGTLLLWVATWKGGLPLPPTAKFALIFGLALVLMAVAIYPMVVSALRAFRGFVEVVLPGVGQLVGSSVVVRRSHTTATIMVFAAIVGGASSVLILLSSVTTTLDSWISAMFPDAVLVRAGQPSDGVDRELISRDVVAAIRSLREVDIAMEMFLGTTVYRGEEVALTVLTMDALETRGSLPWLKGSARSIGRLEVGISEAFANHFDVSLGDSIEMMTGSGVQTFEVSALFQGYEGHTGSILMDVQTFDDLWKRSGATQVAVWSSLSSGAVVDVMRSRVGLKQPLFFISGSALQRRTSENVAPFLGILYSVCGLMCAMGALAVMILLLGTVSERRREILLLRSTGATRWQLTLLVSADGALLAILGTLCGLTLGTVCAVPMLEVLSERFGGRLGYSVDLLEIAVLGLGAVGLSVLTSLYPAWATRRIALEEIIAGD